MSQQQMLEGLSKLRCGACGCDSVRMFRNPHGVIFTECTGCNSLTELKIADPQVSFAWPRGVDSKGIMCEF